jgi:RimJ/RimL family protein N-acetyltransferase
LVEVFPSYFDELLHQLTSQSLYGPSKTLEETEQILKNILPVVAGEGEKQIYRVAYLVHEVTPPSATAPNPPPRFIGLVTLRSLSPDETASHPRLGHASTPTTLSLEIAYMFLPESWGRGYATESITAIFDACKTAEARAFWAPFENVYVRAIVNDENGPSQRVMEKCGMGKPEIIEFKGGRFFIAGKWREEHRLFIYGKTLVE